MTDVPICGFGLKGQGLCRIPSRDGGFCTEHADRVCVGCGQRATRECGSGTCPAVLCAWCTHLGRGQHARPASRLELAEQQMVDAIVMVLADLAQEEILPSTGPQREAAAPRLLRGLTLHTTLKMMMAMGSVRE